MILAPFSDHDLSSFDYLPLVLPPSPPRHAADASVAQLESALRSRLPRAPHAALRSAIDALVADSRIYETDTNVYRALAGSD